MVTSVFTQVSVSLLLVLTAVLFWLLRGYRKQIKAQAKVVASFRSEHEVLKRSERLAQLSILRLEKMLEFAELAPEVQEEVVAYVKAVDEENRARLAEGAQARNDEYWSYLRANFPDWFRFKECHCGGSMGESAPGRGRNRLSTGSPPFLHRKCTACGHVEELRDRQYGDHLEFRKRHGLWHPI
jgi:hypothetical protein